MTTLQPVTTDWIIDLATTGRKTTRLGYGCSSLMGAMGRKESLAMLECAFDAGVRHFDVAPMYGFGQAEICLGGFLARHRSDVTVTTKYGIPPAKNQGLIGVARSIARPIVKLLPGLKKGLSQVEVEASDLSDDRLLRLLEDSVAAGTIGTFGVGSGGLKIGALLAARPEYCPVVQFEWSVMDPQVPSMASFRIHHRALTDNFRTLHAELAADTTRCTRWSAAVDADLADTETLASLMLKASLVENPEAVILFSSKSPTHMRHNVAVAQDASLVAPARRLYELVQQHRVVPG
jgi:D-threo-aldose 1-dehydrogenase